VRGKEEEFGVLVIEADRAGSEEREDSRKGKDNVKRCSV